MEGACPKSSPGQLDPTPDAALDHQLNASGVLPRGGEFSWGKVIGRKHDPEGNPIGIDNAQPVLDTRWYEVEFGYGYITKLTSNVIV